MMILISKYHLGQWLFFFLMLGCLSTKVYTAVSHKNEILHFDSNNDGRPELTLSSNGLSNTGIASCSTLDIHGQVHFAGSNVVVQGNLIIYNDIGNSFERFTTSGELGSTSIVIAEASTNITLRLPEAALHRGKTITVKNMGSKKVNVSSSNLIDDSHHWQLQRGDHFPSMKVFSTGEQWSISSICPASQVLRESDADVSSTNLVGWWRLNEVPGATSALDSSGHGRHGTHTNFASPSANIGVSGSDGLAVSYDGSDDYTSLPALNLSSNTVSITAWVYLDAEPPNGAGILYCRGGSTVSGLKYVSASKTLGYHWNDQYFGVNTGLRLTVGTWHFVAISVQGDRAVLTVDESSYTKVGEHLAEAFDAEIRIAQHNYSGGLNIAGRVDEVRVYNRALSDAEVQKIYQFSR
jgi:hypothetical protein